MDDQKPNIYRGRGGRGAILLAAVNNQPRRPGESSGNPVAQLGPSPSPANGSALPQMPPIAIGRGALLQKLLESRAPAATAASSTSDDKPRIIGRGQALAGVLGRGRSIVLAPTSEPSPVQDEAKIKSVFSPVPEPPIEEMEGMSIAKYSGSSGRPLQMEVNYVRLKTIQECGICEYHVDFVPVVDSRNMRFKLLSQPQVKNITGNVKSFDGSKLYLPKKLPAQITVAATMPTDNSEVSIHIKYVKQACGRDIIHLYNLLFKKIMTILKMTPIGRNYFNPKGGIPVPQHSLEVWPGYVVAVQEYEGGVMLNCDSSFRVLRTVTARDIICQCATNADRMQSEIEKNLMGTVVLTRYNNKTYRVDDIAFDMNPLSTFTTSDGKEISFMDYYKNSYDIVIKDMKQPLLVNRPKKRVTDKADRLLCLVPELCFMTGLTDAMRNDFKVMKDIASHTRVTPQKRQYCLKEFVRNIVSTPEAAKILEDWNLAIDSASLTLDGRMTQPETIHFKTGNCFAGEQADWTKSTLENKVLVPVDLLDWLVVCTTRDSSKVKEFIKMMMTVCSRMGIRVEQPKLREIGNDRTESYCNELRSHVNPRVQLVVVIFPTARDDRYSAIKKLCCVDMPIPSQVINVRTISQYQKLRSVTQKIALQINCKLGGELWCVGIPLENIMVCGMDAYHDTTNKKKSVLAFVASVNPKLTRWFSMAHLQKSGQELGDCLKILFIAALTKYHQINHKLPQKIFIYRDGVGDGMLDTVVNYEVPQFMSCFGNMQQGYNPSLSVIVVQKRINTRMYAVVQNNLHNPPPGTILDHTVTRKGMYDFFLVSQHVKQGTVTPTHYVVSHDSTSLKTDHMQRLTYKMTHLYYNCLSTIRVPAPCQYAHRLAFLVGQNLHKEANAVLADKLFYL